MANPPKALLFDIGGVVVVSPFQAILDFELAHLIPPGYVNFTIQATSPNGSWQQLERGQLQPNDTFFTLFQAELDNPAQWRAHCGRMKQQGGRAAALLDRLVERQGGRVDEHGFPPMPPIDARAMFWNMMRLARQPDPYVYPALKRLRESGKFVIAALSNTIGFPEDIVDNKGKPFNSGMLTKPNREEAPELGNLRDNFDTFVSSAHVGMRKPEKRIYELAVQEIQRVAASKPGIKGPIEVGDILFLDDIGGNLKAAKQIGMRTIKVTLGKSRDAVVELEEAVGIPLLESSSRL